MRPRRSATGAATVLLLGLAGRLAAQDCEDLVKLRLPSTTITLAETVPAGEFRPPATANPRREAGPYENLPAFCRVAATLDPSGDSEIRVEVWMPTGGWNGRFLGVGNGGFAGSIIYGSLANAIANGYAAAATDTGHSQNELTAGWALGHPEKITDFGYRAIHETAVKGKAIVEAFYGEGARHSYFSSCSNGGRQALMEAQRFPTDYDGIIAGAPANDWTHLFTGFVWNSQALDAEGYIPQSKLPAIADAAVAACDQDDGVADGVIDNPAACSFDPGVLICEAGESEKCLTAPQAEALRRVYEGPKDSAGKPIFPGFPPGAETGEGGWTNWILGAAPKRSLQYFFSTQFFSNMVLDDPSWDPAGADVDMLVQQADEKMAPILNATDPDLGAFRERGGKLILYHGWADAAIPAQSSIEYFDQVAAEMGAEETDSFLRLFLVPGMQHCSRGPGPNSFGPYPAPGRNGEDDMMKALERWVEEGIAPEKIIATKYEDDRDPASRVIRTRPLCPHPLVARYNGSGSTDEAPNFSCVESR